MTSLRELLNRSRTQLIILAFLGIASGLLNYVRYSGVMTEADLDLANYGIASDISFILGLATFVVVLWAGHDIAKAVKGNERHGGFVGSIGSAVSAAITGLIGLAFTYPAIAMTYESLGAEQLKSMLISFGPVGFAVGILVATILGFIVGVIGGFFGKDE